MIITTSGRKYMERDKNETKRSLFKLVPLPQSQGYGITGNTAHIRTDACVSDTLESKARNIACSTSVTQNQAIFNGSTN